MREDTVSTLEIHPGDGIRIRLGDTLLDVRSVADAQSRNNISVSAVDMEEVFSSLSDTSDGHCSVSYTGRNDVSVLFEGRDQSSEIVLRSDGTWYFAAGVGESRDARYKLYGNTED